MWDFGHNTLAGGGRLFAGPAAAGRLAPRFAVEPPPLVEYSNSTGAVIACRPFVGGQHYESASTVLPSQPSAQLSAGNNLLATAISWRQVRKLAGSSAIEVPVDDSSVNYERQQLAGNSNQQEENQQDEQMTELDKHSDKNGQLRFVRQDGSLVLGPFGAADFRPNQVHTYRCCLANQFGSVCSRPVRTRAGKLQPVARRANEERTLAPQQ